ncbi:MAG TPA: PA0069 family radical SAM protein [Steroidobacteraceae bacterium]|nr:PA0069 family radical SAM protein [Steroidobacteraceae bacterium]
MAGSLKGRGALSNPAGRFNTTQTERVDDGWYAEEAPPSVATHVAPEQARSIISTNDSPDIPFEYSINPYRGCEHGCPYCYARPSHAYLGLSPGLDFETRLFYKPDAAQLLEAELAAPGYVCKPIALGSNTDPYQPVERKLRVTRSILEVLARCRHPVTVVTKGALLLRDLDLLADLARDGLASVAISITSLDPELKRSLEPRASSPQARLRMLRELTAAGVPAGVLVAPVIPALNDHEMEAILESAADAGARWAGYVVLRLPHELAALFREWLAEHQPQRAQHVMSIVQSLRGGRDNDPRFGSRMRGDGVFAELLRSRFQLACRRLHLGAHRRHPLSTDRFRPPGPGGSQLKLEI